MVICSKSLTVRIFTSTHMCLRNTLIFWNVLQWPMKINTSKFPPHFSFPYVNYVGVCKLNKSGNVNNPLPRFLPRSKNSKSAADTLPEVILHSVSDLCIIKYVLNLREWIQDNDRAQLKATSAHHQQIFCNGEQWWSNPVCYCLGFVCSSLCHRRFPFV